MKTIALLVLTLSFAVNSCMINNSSGGSRQLDNKTISPVIIDGGGFFDLSQPGKSVNAGNPLITNAYCADPTAIEHEGRLYVYGTNDHQQYLYNKSGKNTYERISSLVMFSTDDMVNWTYHGTIDTKKLAPWIISSWAPSIVSRVEDDGKTHFYLYFSNSGYGVGVLTATSPTGPWTSPLNKSLIDGRHPLVNNEFPPFDPGVVIDEHGVGWLSFGGSKRPGSTDYMPGSSYIVKLSEDMISFSNDDIKPIPAPYFFEASELNYINGTYVYTYNTIWGFNEEQVDGMTPCCMAYMTTKTPLDPESWEYRGKYFKNPGEHGLEYSNNHSHLHKYNGEYYLFYHTLYLQKMYNVPGGFRSIFADKIEVDEATLKISMATPTVAGIQQIKDFDPARNNFFSTLAAAAGLDFTPYDENGNMFVTSMTDGSWTLVRGVAFPPDAKTMTIKVRGEGKIEIHIDNRESPSIAESIISHSGWTDVTITIPSSVSGRSDIYFIFDAGISAYTWTF